MEVLVCGKGASKGKARGKVVVLVESKTATSRPSPGVVVVIRFLSPFEIPFVLEASAIVTDFGGMTSHGAIVARELGIPCVVDTKNATEILKDGMEVLVNGESGLVYR